MERAEFWKNFSLGEELSISGTFIYNGLRRFFEMKVLDHPDEVFEVLYNLSVGIERLLKIAVILLEHSEDKNQDEFEKSLITHNHLVLLRRITTQRKLNFGKQHIELLSLLSTFYKTYRYDRFSLSALGPLDKEKKALVAYFSKHLNSKYPERKLFSGTENDICFKKFLKKIAQKIASEIYTVICDRARELRLYTYELRHGSKAQTVFLGETDIPTENLLWKELLIFFMNTKSTSGYMEFLRGIEPLDFDPACVDEYLDALHIDSAKSYVIDELDFLYQDLEDKGQRLQTMEIIGSQGIFFDDGDMTEENEQW